MSNPPTIYYLLFIKQRNLKPLVKAHLNHRLGIYTSKDPLHIIHRLQLNTILVGEYTSYICVFDYVTCILEYFSDWLIPPHHACFYHTGNNHIGAVNYLSLLKCRFLLNNKTQILMGIEDCLSQLNISKQDIAEVKDEMIEALEFLFEICGLLRSSKYALLIISSKKEINFLRFLPASVC